MYIDIYKDQMLPAELFGRQVLYTKHPIAREEVPEGWCCYDLCGTDRKPNRSLKLTDAALIYHTGTVLSPRPLKRSTTLERKVTDLFFPNAEPLTLAEFCRKQNLPCPQDPRKYVLRPASPEEAGLFYALPPERDEALGAIGHVRIDFGGGGSNFHHSWWPRGPEELNTQEFRDELGSVVDELRRSVLKDLSSMRRYCWGAVPETPEPEKPWSYDHDRLLAAWNAGDWSRLHTRDREILDVCDNVIQSYISADMSDYDKELAIHDWMIDWGSYDSDTLNHQQNAQPNPDHDNPYGFLIGKKGICLGYTSTFQLFMDMVGIPCMTVHGTAYSKTQEHAWNMVSLDGEWYCVDVTWDDPTTYSSVSRMTAHMYFNVTSEFLRGRDHQWDASSVSEATATTYAWNPYQ